MDLPLVNQSSAFYEIWPFPAVTHDGDDAFCGGCAAEVCSARNMYASTTAASTVTYQSGGNRRGDNSEGEESWKKLSSAGNGWDQREEGGGGEAMPKQEFIHVRARRGQATDSHSLAERVRREKISERMRILQGLVPGCSRVTGKALILDEIINYIQSLENQIQLLSMKLEAFDNSGKGGVGRWSSC